MAYKVVGSNPHGANIIKLSLLTQLYVSTCFEFKMVESMKRRGMDSLFPYAMPLIW